ncbi:hypothetical protein [Streptomyces sp. NBC_00859]|uniref:hypothetical protein n=1 Tax=Streptomyces sp. NBC_00859 TaxID=2903682 RepID=UPI00386A5959|nr:hypothetical protein OG584_26240 [Streptomyces sp. NBC_00859]
MPNSIAPNPAVPSESEADLTDLRGDCARMAPHWVVPAGPAPTPVPPSLIHGITVPPASARLIDSMSEYGD